MSDEDPGIAPFFQCGTPGLLAWLDDVSWELGEQPPDLMWRIQPRGSATPYLMAERNSLWKRGAPNRRAQTTQSSNRSLGRTTDLSLK